MSHAFYPPRSLVALLVVASGLTLHAQVPASPHDSVTINASSNALLSSFRFRSIGPASMGGRVDDIEVAPSDPSVIYVGYAAGGVFKSVNNGTTFTPVFETYNTASIGDIAIHPTNPSVVYVGTGEPNNRQTSTFGDGIYKSVDGGKTFTNVGLKETQTIARIVIDPRHPEVVYVASPGHLFGPNEDRGVYKTTDGGKTWNKIKYIDENTGFIDIAMDPSNSNVLYAASYQRRRSGCCYNGGGAGSALWKTDDAGRTWTKLTRGLPTGTLGRIAIAVSHSNPNIVYAQVEAQGAAAEPAEPPAQGGGRGAAYDWCNNGGPGHGFGGGRGGAGASAEADTNRTPPALDASKSGVFRSSDKGRSWTAVSNCDARPLYFSQIRIDPTNDHTIYVAGVHMAKSLDAGKTFTMLDNAGGFFNMGEDQHAIWIDPKNPNHILRGNDAGLMSSEDQGATWEYIRTMATAQTYWVTADMGHPYFVYAGMQDNDSWAGPSATRSRVGITSHDWFHLSGGDGFQTAVDPTDFHTIYSESQDGSVFRTDLRAGRSTNIRPVAPPASRGAATQAGTTATGTSAAPACVDGRVAAAGGRGGAGAGGGGGGGGGRGAAQPNVLNARAGDTYRFNWNTPVLLSPHNSNELWVGGNRLFRSLNRGESWVASTDLTKQIDRCTVTLMGLGGTESQLSKNDGVTAFSTITALSESPVIAGVVWAGTDDGNLQLTRDDGATFTNVAANLTGLPKGAVDGSTAYWISRIEASHFDPATAYVAVDGHRSDDLKPYIFVTHDYGHTFRNIGATLPPDGNVQVVREDPKNPSLLYAGTEFGLFISLDAGAHWEKFMTNFPTVRTDDILIHPRDGDMIVATHGRSLWIADDITALEQFTPAVASQDVYLFDPRSAVAYLFDYHSDADIGGSKHFVAENPPRGAAISYYLKSAVNGDVSVSVLDAAGRMLCKSTAPASAGIHRVQWTLGTPMIAPAGGGRGGAADAGGGAGGGAAGAAGGRGGARTDTTCGGSNPRAVTPGTPLAPGVYTVKLSVAGRDYTKPLTIVEDSWLFER